MRRAFFSFLTALIILSSFPLREASAIDCTDPATVAKSFASTQNIIFVFDDFGVASVSHKVSLKNLTDECVADRYPITVSSTKVKAVSGRDSLGDLSIALESKDGSTYISPKLNDTTVGKNKSVAFEINYVVDGLAAKDGLIWDLVIPKLVTTEQIEAFNLSVWAPVSFGQKFSASPEADETTSDSGRLILTWKKNPAFGISVNFGENQQIGFNFNLLLVNSSTFKKAFRVPLPPDTEKQQILIAKISPYPERISVDDFGNYLAEFTVGGKNTQKVNVQGVVRLPSSGWNLPTVKDIPNKDLKVFLKEGNFVSVQDKLIQEKAKELASVEAIYKFVTSYLTFDSKSLGKSRSRLGAANLLRKKEGATSFEFADLFVALARAAGIPSREVVGFAVSKGLSSRPTFVGDYLNTDNLHVWVQVFDENKKRWVDVDPTWGAASGIDFVRDVLADRFVLVLTHSGEKIGDIPVYALSSENIQISYSDQPADFTPNIDFKISTDQAYAGFPIFLTLSIKNKSGVSLINGKITISTKKLGIVGDSAINLPPIFPYEERQVKVKLRSGELFRPSKGQVTAVLEASSGDNQLKQSKESTVLVQSFFSFGSQQVLLLFLIFLVAIGVISRKLPSRMRKRKDR